MGAGSGAAALALSEIATSVVGLEPLARYTVEAKRRAADRKAENVDFVTRPYDASGMPGSTFDLVYGACVIERGGPGAISEARRLLRHGGTFLSLETNLRAGADRPFFELFNSASIERFGIVTRVSIYKATKGKAFP
jgi:SAM-dependent methyltransferase